MPCVRVGFHMSRHIPPPTPTPFPDFSPALPPRDTSERDPLSLPACELLAGARTLAD